MSIIKPFKGIRYDLAKTGELASVIAPPYDVIPAESRDVFYKRSPFNIIRLILGKDEPGDNAQRNKYTRASALWDEWRKKGVLVRDPSPRIYRYLTNYSLKTPEGIVTRERPGFVALLKLHEYSSGKVLPHERTLAGPKQDRFQLMLHTRAHFSQVFMLYSDPKGKVDDALGIKPPKGQKPWAAEDDLGVSHEMWAVEDKDAIKAATKHLEKVPLYIADGHHRYETSLTFSKHQQKASPLFAEGTDYVLAYFTPAEHEGLHIFPYHRLLHNLPKKRFSGLLKKLSEYFEVDSSLMRPLDQGSARRDFMIELEKRGGERTVFAMVDGLKNQAHFLSLKPDAPVKRSASSEAEAICAELDVVILEDLVLTGMLGIKAKDLVNEKYVSYETDYDRVLDLVQKPPNQMVFLMNHTPIQDVLRVADHQGIMPEKSTYFFPKLASGLVMNSMEE